MAAKPRILATRRFPEAVEQRLARDYRARLNRDDRLLAPEALLDAASDVDGLFITATERLDETLIRALPEPVRIVGTLSVGVDHIDLDAARARGLAVVHTPDVLSEACADVAMLLLLAAARRGHEADRMVRTGAWRGWAPTQLLGLELNGKVLGILGMGRIGRALAARARGFGLSIHYSNRKRLPPALEQGAVFHADAEELVTVSRFFSLNCPSTDDTRGFLDARRIALLPDRAVVVNIARGDLIDDDALIAALGSGKIFAAGLDVFNNEPAIDPRYAALPNLFLSPHIGSATIETRNAMGFLVLDGFDAFFAGRPLASRIV